MNLSEKLWYLNMAMGIYGCGMYIFLNVIAKSEIPVRNFDEPTSASICDMAECHQWLQSRLETVESAVRAIVSVLSIQKSQLFNPVNRMLAQNRAIREILSRSETEVTQNSVDVSTIASGPNDATVEDNPLDATKESVENLKGAIKCSLANLININTIDFNLRANQPMPIKTSVIKESLEITWPIPSVECHKFSSGVWIRIYQTSQEENKLAEEATSISIPQKCLLYNTDASHSIVLFPQSTPTDEKDPCFFFLARNLTQCRAYVVEIIPNYQSLRGKTLRTEIVVPPKQSHESSMKPLINVVAHSNSLTLNWEDNSGCAPQLTSLNLKIFKDGIVTDSGENASTTIRIPRSCLKHSRKKENLFLLELPADDRQTCSLNWKPLDKCRKYKLDVSSQYSAWNSPSSSWEIFTGQEGNYPVNISDFLRCPKEYYYCPFHGCQQVQPSISQSDSQCSGGRDKKQCDTDNCYENKFRCGQQCLPKKLVCDGKYDCLDGSDEGYDCSYGYMCQQFTNASGHFSSRLFKPKPAFEIHSDRIADVVRKTAVLISVQPNHQIWLTFNKFVTFKDQHFVKVYDGPYMSSPLLLSHSGSNKPYSIRSSSSDLFVEFPSYYDTNYGIEAFYTTINHSNEQFVPGCGGYINGDGVLSTRNYLSKIIADCFWFIESWNSEDSFLLRRNSFDLKISQTTTLLSADFVYPTVTVYDGWSTNGLVLYDGKPSSDLEENTAIFSITNKMLVHLKQPEVKEYRPFYWNVSKISTPQCKNHYKEISGTIKSPNYPLHYPHLTDCRWTITVKPGSKVRLLFAFFETQEGADFISVYDGPTVHSQLLLVKSGSVPTPFVVNFSTNEVLIRFTSDGDTSFPGFLAVYSSV